MNPKTEAPNHKNQISNKNQTEKTANSKQEESPIKSVFRLEFGIHFLFFVWNLESVIWSLFDI